MYLAVVVLTMFVLPIASMIVDHIVHPVATIVLLCGRWFVFWGVGVRLGLAGLRQLLRPDYTARDIFNLQSREAWPIIRELGVSNIATAIVALLSLAAPGFVLPVAISATIFYGFAGVGHALEASRSRNQTIAMISDLFLCLMLIAFISGTMISPLPL